VAEGLPRSGSLVVRPAATTTYWCFPDRWQGKVLLAFGRRVMVTVADGGS
jgi:hypothetical protein